MPADIEQLAAQFPSLAAELRAQSGAPATAAAAPAPAPPVDLDAGRVARLAQDFPSLANELGQAGGAAAAPAAAPTSETAGEGQRGASTTSNGESPLAHEANQLAAELGLDDAGAQKVLEYYRRDGQAKVEVWNKEIEGWRAELARDPEITEATEVTRAFVWEHGGDEFVKALGELGDNPAIVRGLVRMAKAAKSGSRR
jgi:hypothetical protein